LALDVADMLRKRYEAETENYFDDEAKSVLFDSPILAVADAEDPWFARMKEVIGPWHWTPAEAFELAGIHVAPRRVISWCLPVAELPRTTNYSETLVPSRAWVCARMKSDDILARMAHGLEALLREAGFAALAPAQAGLKTPAKPQLTSCWSQRHVGFIAGLGTFGISGGLITRRGIAHRMGSVVTDAPVDVTPRPYGDDPFAWCRMHAKGDCGACIRRCPVASVGKSVHERNKQACADHRATVRRYAIERYGLAGDHLGCGLCQTGVPCETCNPVGG
jgi:epoxyqueuosine reductase QueG